MKRATITSAMRHEIMNMVDDYKLDSYADYLSGAKIIFEERRAVIENDFVRIELSIIHDWHDDYYDVCMAIKPMNNEMVGETEITNYIQLLTAAKMLTADLKLRYHGKHI